MTTALPMSDPAHPFHLTAEQCAALDEGIEAHFDSQTAYTVTEWNRSTGLTRTRLDAIATGHRAYNVVDVQEDKIVATITFHEGGECWNVQLILGAHHTPGDLDECPGNRNFRDFDAACFYATAWAWEVDGDI